MIHEGNDRLSATTVRFCRALRERGVPVGPADAVSAARTLEVVDLMDRREVFLALRSALVWRIEDYPVFSQLFEEVWEGREAHPDASHGPSNPPAPRADARRREKAGYQDAPPALREWLRNTTGTEDSLGAPAFGEQESTARKDFASFSDAELDEISRVARRMARRLAARPGRRWEPVRRGARVDPRRSVRRALQLGGEVVQLSWRRRKPRRTRLVLLCDVSGSMDLYARFLLQFLYAIQAQFDRVESFVFDTRLSRVTEELAGDSYADALRSLTGTAAGWGGGTRIGESLRDFLAGWPRLLDRRTIAIVLSDGWDTGEPEILSDALRFIHRRAGKVIWLNPLLGAADYQPLTRGMQAALPHVDLFAPSHNLASLQALVRELKL